jgi:hypothetical protein
MAEAPAAFDDPPALTPTRLLIVGDLDDAAESELDRDPAVELQCSAVEDALGLVESTRPDVVLLTADHVEHAKQLSRSAVVVVLSSDSTHSSVSVDSRLDRSVIVRTALALASVAGFAGARKSNGTN